MPEQCHESLGSQWYRRFFRVATRSNRYAAGLCWRPRGACRLRRRLQSRPASVVDRRRAWRRSRRRRRRISSRARGRGQRCDYMPIGSAIRAAPTPAAHGRPRSRPRRRSSTPTAHRERGRRRRRRASSAARRRRPSRSVCSGQPSQQTTPKTIAKRRLDTVYRPRATARKDQPCPTSTASSACRLTSSSRSTGSRPAARASGADIIDLGMGNPDLPAPQHVIDKLVETVGQAAHRPLFGLQGHRRPAPRPGRLLRPPLRREAQSRHPGRRDARLEGGLRQHGAGDHRAGRRGAGAEPELSDPRLRLPDGRRRHPLGSGRADAGVLPGGRAGGAPIRSRSRSRSSSAIRRTRPPMSPPSTSTGTSSPSPRSTS